MINKSSLKKDREALESCLLKNGYNGKDKTFICPNPDHDDHSPSANVYETKFGDFYVKCFSCGFHEDIFSMNYIFNGSSHEQTFEEFRGLETKTEERTYGFESLDSVRRFLEKDGSLTIQGIHPYSDTFTVLRYLDNKKDKKTFRSVVFLKGKYCLVEPKGTSPLYCHEKIKEVDNVLIVEGEKCVDMFNSIGIANWVAVTSWGGSNNYYKSDWSSLVNKNVFIWRDNDSPGLKYEANVISSIVNLDVAIDIRIVQVDDLGLEDGEDIVDFSEKITAPLLESVENVLNLAKSFKFTDNLETRITLIEEGKYKSISFPMFPISSGMAQTLVPGTVTMICGNPGAGKSFLITDLGLSLSDSVGFTDKMKFLFLEEDSAFYQLRALAQLSGRSDYTRLEYVRNNIDEVRNDFDFYRENLEEFFRHVEFSGSKLLTSDEVKKWISRQAYSGTRLIVVDPITATKPDTKQWIDDSDFLFGVKEVLEETGASLILTTHPRAGNIGKPGLHGMARSLNFSNFTQYVFWLINHQNKESFIDYGGIVEPVRHNKTLFIEKTRNGSGNGRQIAVEFDESNLRFSEIGVILQETEIAKKIGDF